MAKRVASGIERGLEGIPLVGTQLRWSYAELRRKTYGLLPDRQYLSWLFQRKMGYPLDWNNLQSFSQKLQWMKLYGFTPLHTACCDKMLAGAIVSNLGFPEIIIPEIYRTYDVNDIRPENISESKFVAKVNHDSGGVFICRDSSKLDWAELRRNLSFRLASNFHLNARARHLESIRRGIIVQKLLESPGGEIPVDYKVFCFQGVPQMIQVDIGRHESPRRALMTPDWTPIEVQIRHPWPDRIPERPATLDRMLEVASGLSRLFQFIRVDLYEAEGQVWFGEMSFHPGGGLARITPVSFDYELGAMIDLRLPMVRQAPRPAQPDRMSV